MQELDNNQEFHLSLWDKALSTWNRYAFALRKVAGYSRGYYSESSNSAALEKWRGELLPSANRELENLECKYQTRSLLHFCNLHRYQKNLETLWILDHFIHYFPVSQSALWETALDAGCQDFSRAPGLSICLQQFFPKIRLVGVELDAFPILAGGYSRFDIARHFCRNLPQTRFVAGDFFAWRDPCDFLAVFYPFVSPHPAIAWGLPENFGRAESWLRAINCVLRTGGMTLILHQGIWEEAEWDEARKQNPGGLILVARDVLTCPFYPSRYPMHASLYRRT